MAGKWTAEKIMDITSGYQGACVLFAAADLDIFSILDRVPMTAQALAAKLSADARATAILLDALVAMGLLVKEDAKYSVGPEVAELLMERGATNVLGMVRHRANCLRRWVQLAEVVKSGKPAEHSQACEAPAPTRPLSLRLCTIFPARWQLKSLANWARSNSDICSTSAVLRVPGQLHFFEPFPMPARPYSI